MWRKNRKFEGEEMKGKIKFKDLKEAIYNISNYGLKYAPEKVKVVNGVKELNSEFFRWWRELEKEIKEYGALCRRYGRQKIIEKIGGKMEIKPNFESCQSCPQWDDVNGCWSDCKEVCCEGRLDEDSEVGE